MLENESRPIFQLPTVELPDISRIYNHPVQSREDGKGAFINTQPSSKETRQDYYLDAAPVAA
jgi:hypothetical protein